MFVSPKMNSVKYTCHKLSIFGKSKLVSFRAFIIHIFLSASGREKMKNKIVFRKKPHHPNYSCEHSSSLQTRMFEPMGFGTFWFKVVYIYGIDEFIVGRWYLINNVKTIDEL